ncbi:hypothetical protein [Streptococcus sanguinis]|jgi:hypothetical protein|uniref:Uncharacterized protein n=1 Tax=Streptococcus sanguinis TaxID=1305 RepID=A0AB74DGT2_STRSA|nr:hypothetical protein [Streptococcus sanguinis]MBZ2063002.1 hypothetical protein [Streptococcus sanguinis]MBZ2065213.1 hypothetical protein [Streptococcus sanguinis]RSI28338.1 hypothetical protein D8879_10585 [Streptococcus sanguinis]RSI31230.1 hypothetical protein D8878_11450 [Streptococcus sanguinis]
MRKIIFIGQSGDEAVYYNTRTKEALVADKSALLNTEGARKTNKAIIPLILLFALFGGGTGVTIFSFTTPFRLNESMIPIILLAIFLVFVGSIYMLEKALYKNVRSTVLANEEQFKAAVNSSLIWGGFSDKKATFGKIFFFLFIILILLFCVGIVGMFGIPGMLIPYYNHEWFDLSLLFSPIAGVLPAVVVISLFQNNPIRWLLAVRKYEQGKVIFAEEKEKKHE